MRRPQDAEERRRAFTASLRAAEDRAEREGWVSVEDALAEADRVIDELERERTAKS